MKKPGRKPPCRHCTSPVVAKGLCSKHYNRQRKHGDALFEYKQPRISGQCAVEDATGRCGRPAANLAGYCHMHAKRIKADGSPGPVAPLPMATGDRCTVKQGARRCKRVGVTRGLCRMHYSRLQRLGDVGSVEAKYERGAGSTSRGYRFVHHEGRRIGEHRLVMQQLLGRTLRSDEIVHHRNGRKTDNHPDNLEIWFKGHPRGINLPDLLETLLRDYPRDFWSIVDRLRAESGS